MKILLWALTGFVGLVLLVVITGMMLPKKHRASRTATYRTSPERLYTLISGPQNWRPDVVRDELIAGADRQIRRETTRNNETIDYELLNQVPPATLMRRIATPNLPYAGSWKFELQPQGAATIVRITEDGEVYNPVFRFVSRFIIGHTASIDAYLKALGKATGEDVQIAG